MSATLTGPILALWRVNMERDKIIKGIAGLILAGFIFWSGYNYAMAELYRDYRNIYTNVVGKL